VATFPSWLKSELGFFHFIFYSLGVLLMKDGCGWSVGAKEEFQD